MEIKIGSIECYFLEPLRKEILLHCGKLFMEKMKIFKGLPKSVIKSIVYCLKLEIYLPNDIVITFFQKKKPNSP